MLYVDAIRILEKIAQARWAKDGEYVAYTKLGRCVAQMTGGSTEVARVPGAGPIFSTEF